MNTLGTSLRLTSFGESHGPTIGGIIDGFPPGIRIDRDEVQQALDARRPGASPLTSSRREPDKVEFLSGISPDGRSLGTPIAFIIRNEDRRSADYDDLARTLRPGHADFTYTARYGLRDHRGGGRASARETANWVVAGALARHLLSPFGIEVTAHISEIGGVTDPSLFEKTILDAKNSGDSVGGIISATVTGVPAGIGDPVFSKLDARLAFAMLTINGAKGFEIGDGFALARAKGSEAADSFTTAPDGHIITATNHSGGVQGGISNGMPISFRVPFKPTPTISRPLETVDIDGHSVTLEAHGRHDPCIAVRAVHVVKAMTLFTIADVMITDGLISTSPKK